MRIHTAAYVTYADMLRAAQSAGAWPEAMSEHGSRKRHHAFEVSLRGSSNRRPNGGNRGSDDGYAATWDQWGVFIAAVFELDPGATMTYYKDAADFHYKTGTRFAEGWPTDAHGDHTFRWNGAQIKCTKCSAVQVR